MAIDYEDLNSALSDGLADLQITVVPETWFDPARTTHHPLFAEQLEVILPLNHQLATEPSVTLDSLLGERFLRIDGLPEPLRETFMFRSRRADADSIDASIAAEHMHNLLNHVAQGTGIIAVTAGTSRFYPRPDIAYVPIIGLDPVTLWITHRRDEERPHVLAYVEECVNAVRNSLDLIPTAIDATGQRP